MISQDSTRKFQSPIIVCSSSVKLQSFCLCHICDIVVIVAELKNVGEIIELCESIRVTDLWKHCLNLRSLSNIKINVTIFTSSHTIAWKKYARKFYDNEESFSTWTHKNRVAKNLNNNNNKRIESIFVIFYVISILLCSDGRTKENFYQEFELVM
jgi:hypothetical protein